VPKLVPIKEMKRRETGGDVSKHHISQFIPVCLGVACILRSSTRQSSALPTTCNPLFHLRRGANRQISPATGSYMKPVLSPQCPICPSRVHTNPTCYLPLASLSSPSSLLHRLSASGAPTTSAVPRTRLRQLSPRGRESPDPFARYRPSCRTTKNSAHAFPAPV
jgi:hypothetical protein